MSRQLTCERCGEKTDAGAWIGFVYVGAECLDQDDKETIAELENEERAFDGEDAEEWQRRSEEQGASQG